MFLFIVHDMFDIIKIKVKVIRNSYRYQAELADIRPFLEGCTVAVA